MKKPKKYNMTNIETLEAITGNDHKPEGKIIERTPILGTPFWIIKTDSGCNLTMGKWKLNKEQFTTEDELLEWLTSDKWNIITSMIICITEDIKNQQTN